MRRLVIFCIVILLCLSAAALFRTAVDPLDFTGQWYSASDQSAFFFQEGLIYRSRNSAGLSGTETISGAYTFGKDSIFLFAAGIDGLEEERQLYLVNRGAESSLCENRDGSGKVFFIRYKE